MNTTHGNLALKSRQRADTAAGHAPAGLTSIRPVIKARRIPLAEVPNEQRLQQQKADSIRRAIARQRVRQMLGIIAVVIVISGVFGLVLYRQAMILEFNFQSVALERQIRQVDEESSQIRESLAQKTNLDLIRQQAVGRLGLQDPARSQVVRVFVPDTDRIVYARAGQSADDEASLASAFSMVEGYFKTLRLDQPGD